MRPTPRKPDRPVLWIIAGPNGSGKSTFYNRTDIEGWGGSVWIINPDLLTQQIVEHEGHELGSANGTALDRIMVWLEASIDAYQTIGVETVLSSPKYRYLVQRAKERGFRVRMIYVVLGSPDLQLERIRLRVSEGGHDVDADKAVSRRYRSFEQLAWFAREIERGYIFDNSTSDPKFLADILPGGEFLFWTDVPRDMEQALKQNGAALRYFDLSGRRWSGYVPVRQGEPDEPPTNDG
jgi:predicted ABC-type ATPase